MLLLHKKNEFCTQQYFDFYRIVIQIMKGFYRPFDLLMPIVMTSVN